MPSVSLGPEQQQLSLLWAGILWFRSPRTLPPLGYFSTQGHYHLHFVPSPQTEPKYTFSCLSPHLLGEGGLSLQNGWVLLYPLP